MNDISPELPKQSTEQEPGEILLSKVVAKTLGAGLRQQIFTDGKLTQIKTNIENLRKQNATTQDDNQTDERGKWIERMENDLKRLSDFVFDLEHAKEVKLQLTVVVVGEGDARMSAMSFSKEKDEIQRPEEGKIIINQELTNALKIALAHHLRTPLTGIFGFSELIEVGSKNTILKNEAGQMIEIVRSMNNALTESFEGKQLELLTDKNGRTTIVPVQVAPTPKVG